MQPLQATFLNRIKAGKTPVIIVSPDVEDGDALSFLVAGALTQPEGGTVDTILQRNYFLNAAVLKLYDGLATGNLPTADGAETDASEKIKGGQEDDSAQQRENKGKTEESFRGGLKFAIELGIANKELLGVQIGYKVFIDYKVYDIFPDAFYLFVYGTELNGVKDPGFYFQRIIEVVDSKADSSLVLHLKNVLYAPDRVVNLLPIEKTRKGEGYINHTQFASYQAVDYFWLKSLDAWMEFDKRNSLIRSSCWLSGADILVILPVSVHSDMRRLAMRVREYENAFVSTPKLYVICQAESIRYDVERSLIKVVDSVDIKIITCTTSMAAALNDIVNSAVCEFVVVDDHSLSFSISQSVTRLRDSLNVYASFGSLALHKQSAPSVSQVNLVDVLAMHTVLNNIIFRRSTWKAAFGFDETLDNHISLWDFLIRVLHATGGYAIGNDSVIAGHVTNFNDVEASMIPFEGYARIVTKHKALFEANVMGVIKLYADHQLLPQREIVRMLEKVEAMGSVLSHSKYELKSINALNVQLQQQITLMEGRWYFRLARRVGKLKKIFFKESGSNKSGILKFLRFFVFALTKPGFRIARKVIKGGFKKIYLIIEDRPVKIVYLDSEGSNASAGVNSYDDWILKKLEPETLKKEYQEIMSAAKTLPKISIVMPVYDPPLNFLKEAIESVTRQSYPNWELCIADDKSPNPNIEKILRAYSIKDSRIKVVIREENGHISASSNSALALATGDYILFMDHDDLLTPNCCAEVVKFINENPDKDDIIYSDEDKIDSVGNHSAAHFKPDWSPDNLLSRNYFGHVVVMRKTVVDAVGGFRLGFEGSQDYDIILRATEVTQKIGHIPKVLYHWRIHEKSAAQGEDVKPYAYVAAKRALEEALHRRHTPGEVSYLAGLRGYNIHYRIVRPGKVSVIIPTKDQVKLTKNTIDSIIERTTYEDYEIILLNNNSTTDEFFQFVKEYTDKYPDLFRCIEANFPFNFSKLMNIGVRESNGEYVLLLNNDIEVISEQWMTTMVSYAQRNSIGAVGARLLYPDDTIQHAGVLIGLGGVAGHAFTHSHRDDPGYFNYIQSVNNYSAVTAACIMVRRSVYDEVGGMEESFEVEYNDVDFCLKIADAGYYNVYVPDVTLYHYESATRGHPHQNKESYARHVKEVNLFLEKWDKYIKHDPYFNPNLNRGVHDFRLDFSK